MNLIKLKRLMTGSALAFALAVGLTVIASTPAQAQHRNDGYYGGQGRDNYGYGNDVYRKAYDNGYNSGVSHGRDHSRQRHRYDPTDPSEYRSGTKGYHSDYGSKDAYKQSFREGFRAGYDVGYRQNGGYSNDPYYRGNPRGNDPHNDPYYRGGQGRYPSNGGHGQRRGRWWPF